jgi:hypothetical protein
MSTAEKRINCTAKTLNTPPGGKMGRYFNGGQVVGEKIRKKERR